jgi:hypothetical protein
MTSGGQKKSLIYFWYYKFSNYLCIGFKHNRKMKHSEIFSMCIKMGERNFNTQETLMVLRHNRNIFWSWGVSKMVNLQNKGLILKVSGHHHKGWVLVTLGWEDLYKVHIVSNSGKVLYKYEGIFFDDLVDIIDNRIEKIPDYKY